MQPRAECQPVQLDEMALQMLCVVASPQVPGLVTCLRWHVFAHGDGTNCGPGCPSCLPLATLTTPWCLDADPCFLQFANLVPRELRPALHGWYARLHQLWEATRACHSPEDAQVSCVACATCQAIEAAPPFALHRVQLLTCTGCIIASNHRLTAALRLHTLQQLGPVKLVLRHTPLPEVISPE